VRGPVSTSTLLCLSIFIFSCSSAVKHGPHLRGAKVQRRSAEFDKYGNLSKSNRNLDFPEQP